VVPLKKRQLFLAAPAMVAVVAAGCGGSKTPNVASLGPSTTGSTTTSQPSGPAGNNSDPNAFVRFVACMQRHGIHAQIGQGGRGVSISGGDPSSPQFKAAQKVCQKLLPGGGPQPLTPAQEAQEVKELLVLAKCMRRHGYPSFPDPDSQGVFDFSGASAVDPNSTQFQQAMSTCRPGGGKVPLRIGIRVTQGPGGGSGGGG